MNYLILVVFAFCAIRLIRWDTARRDGISPALWIPTIWAGILASRPVSAWFGGGAVDTLEGSPADRIFYLLMIIASFVILAHRSFSWSSVIARNWAVFLFYAFLLVSISWANSPIVSFKRFFKEFGNIPIALLLLTEVNPLNAIRTVFARCAYVLFPLSVIFIRYFPSLGRRYGIHSGFLEATGVTLQKNSLGTMVVVCGLILLWDWLDTDRSTPRRRNWMERWLAPVILAIGAYLLYLSDSKTSIVCFALGGLIIASIRLAFIRRRTRILGRYVVLGVVLFFTFEYLFGVSAHVVANLGRDMTFTGRTDVWRELLKAGTDPVLGTGFMSFWDDAQYRSRLPSWVAFSAHNGYLEIYLAGGVVGLGFLVLMLSAVSSRINAALGGNTNFSAVRLAIFVVMLLANISESNFACMTPLGFLFLVAAIGCVRSESRIPQLNAAFPHSPSSYQAAPS